MDEKKVSEVGIGSNDQIVNDSVKVEDNHKVSFDKRSNRLVFWFVIQTVLLFVPVMETLFVRRSVFDLIKRIPRVILTMDLTEMGLYRRFEEVDVLLYGVAAVGLIGLIITVFAVISLIRRKFKGFVILTRINQFFYFLMGCGVIVTTMYTFIEEYDDVFDELVYMIHALVPVLLIAVFWILVNTSALIASFRVKKDVFKIEVKSLIGGLKSFSVIYPSLVVIVTAILLINGTNLRMTYNHNSRGLTKSVATVNDSDDAYVQMTFILEDEDDYDDLEDLVDDYFDRVEDRFDDIDVSVDWEMKKGLFGKAVIEIEWEEVTQNEEFYRVVIGGMYNRELMASAVGSYELTDDHLDNDAFEDRFRHFGHPMASKGEAGRKEYKQLEDYTVVLTLADYICFESVKPMYYIDRGNEYGMLALGANTYHAYGREIIVDMK